MKKRNNRWFISNLVQNTTEDKEKYLLSRFSLKEGNQRLENNLRHNEKVNTCSLIKF